MTTDIVIIYKDREIMLELNATGYVPATRHSPPEDPEFEILRATTRDGDVLDDDAIEYITNHEQDQVWQKLEDMAEYTRDDYLLEKHEDRARTIRNSNRTR